MKLLTADVKANRHALKATGDKYGLDSGYKVSSPETAMTASKRFHDNEEIIEYRPWCGSDSLEKPHEFRVVAQRYSSAWIDCLQT